MRRLEDTRPLIFRWSAVRNSWNRYCDHDSLPSWSQSRREPEL